MNELELMLVTIGDLEFSRRKLLIELQKVQAEVEALKAELESVTSRTE